MEVHFAVVLDRNASLDPDHWHVSAIADTRAALPLEHDGHVILVPRKAGDRRIEEVTVVDAASGRREAAGVYRLG